MTYSRIWGHNFPISALVVPLGISLFHAITHKNSSSWKWSCFFIGLLSASYFTLLSLPISLGICLAVSLIFQPTFFPKELGQKNQNPDSFLSKLIPFRWLLCILFILVTHNVGAIFEIKFSLFSSVTIGSIGWISFEAFRFRYQVWNTLSRLVIIPGLIGWLVAVNVCCLYWGRSFHGASISKGFAGSGLPWSEWIQQIDLVWFLTLHSYNILFLLPLIVGVFYLTSGKRLLNQATLLLLAISVGGLILSTVISAETSLLKKDLAPGYFGITPMRYYIGVPFFLSIALLVGFQKLGITRQVFLTLFVGLFGILSFSDYVKDQSLFVEEVSSFNEKTDALIQEHLSHHHEHVVVCARTKFPGIASRLYAENNYRTPLSAKKHQLKNIGSVFYINDISAFESSEEILRSIGLKTPSKAFSVLVIHENVSSAFLEPKIQNNLIGLSVSYLK